MLTFQRVCYLCDPCKSIFWKSKNDAHQKLLSSSDKLWASLIKSFKKARSLIQLRTCQIKHQYWLDISFLNQSACNCEDSILLYHQNKQDFHPQAMSMIPFKSKDRSVLFKNLECIMKCWTEHFEDLQNWIDMVLV